MQPRGRPRRGPAALDDGCSWARMRVPLAECGSESTRAGAKKCVVSRPMLALIAALTALAPDTGYWQQHVDYRISAALDEPSGVLTGHARIAYVNRSPDTLRDFYVHQYLNAFRPGSRWSAADSAE